MTIDRRTVLTAAGAAALASQLPSTTANAASPPTGQQNAGFYRYKVGDFEITVVTDGVNRFKVPENFITNVKFDDVKAEIAQSFMSADEFSVPYSPIVVNTGSKLIVIDTGTGEANFATSKGAAGQFQRNLAAAGIDAKNVDTVIISHYHGDHVNGLLKADGTLAFPNAEILVPATEHKFWMDDGEMSRATPGRMQGLFKNNRSLFSGEVAKRVKTYDAGKEVVSGITAVATPGHTPGHTSHIIASGNKRVVAQADVTNVPFLFAKNPGWHAAFDQDGKMAEETRRKFYDMLAAEKVTVQGFHYPFPAVGHVEKDGNGYRVIPVMWSSSL
ncbi:putative quorum-quenching lactonase YtnP [Variibacter gotjawalensis]|uniref:Putative quorum-quenching lactonase YtnP n=1 Tax=Variibacter gotjawalensis TaxID=1333996 RepID=A0A0S3PW97_9BRAD|nr:MBL fold metallo-hydrolase [Variibacter gotjawalensis]NIK46041.1 glyoxylase-like metal-dependent hydrolase (beta-lactamase superfamily II) [Variibacter gotjawalensis]RZS47959.1 metallo-beta-lactamase superfamily protein [Variibacter gotjawalensis]BAT60215.1 putative quorum-quenching lactonase YtnP [Variibacter gotjawalensis]